MKYTPREVDHSVNSSQENPLKEFASLVAVVVIFVATIFAIIHFGVKWTIGNMGPETELKVATWLNVFDSNSQKSNRDLKLEKLMLQKVVGDFETRLPVKIRVIKQSEPNAFCYLGGVIVVSTGLLEEIETENELTFVLAHELGHLQLKHNLESLSQSATKFLFTGLLALGGFSDSVLQTILGAAELSYSRSAEREADGFALKKTYEIYGHLGGAFNFFQRQADKKSILDSRWTAFMSTHPASESRIEDLKKMAIEENMPLTGEVTSY